MSTGFGRERAHKDRRYGPLSLGRSFTPSPARSSWRTTIIGVDTVATISAGDSAPNSAPITSSTSAADPVAEVLRITDGRGVDVAIGALGTQQNRSDPACALRPGGVL